MIQKYFKIFDIYTELIFNKLGFLKKKIIVMKKYFFHLKNLFLVFQLYVNNNNI